MSDTKKTKTPSEVGIDYQYAEGNLLVFGVKEAIVDSSDEEEEDDEDYEKLARLGIPTGRDKTSSETVFMSGNILLEIDDITMASDTAMMYNKEWIKVSKVDSITLGEFYLFIPVEEIFKLKVQYAKEQRQRFQIPEPISTNPTA